MSITVEYLFNASSSLQDVASRVGAALGVRFEAYAEDPSDLFCRFLSLECSLGEHDLVNDGECTFEDFRFLLETRTAWPEADLRAYQLEIMALVPYVLYARAGIESGILVFDGQILLARYAVRAESQQQPRGLQDLLSGNDVRFPGHLMDVAGRIPRGLWKA